MTNKQLRQFITKQLKSPLRPEDVADVIMRAIEAWHTEQVLEIIGEDDYTVTMSWTPNATGTPSVSTAKSATNQLREQQRARLKESE